MTATMDAGDAAVMAFVQRMPKADRWLFQSWRDTGHGLMDALAESRLLTGGRRHPEQVPASGYAAGVARLEQLREPPTARADRHTAEHEAAHAWVALVRGLNVHDVRMVDENGHGSCRFVEGPDPVDNAAVYLAGELWISQFRSDRFPGGATGCALDRRNILARVDDRDVHEAGRRAYAALYERQADVLALADRLQRRRVVNLDE